MKIGLIARCDNRGLGMQTFEFFRNMPVDKVLVLVAGKDLTNGRELSPGFTQHPERYTSHPLASDRWVRVVTWNAGGPAPAGDIMDFLDELDVVYTAETPYWFELYEIAERMKVKTVCHSNPEFYRYHREPNLSRPSAIWLPSTWLSSGIPDGKVMPFPVARDSIPYRHRTAANTFLHVVGHRTVRDRNGTLQVYRTFRRVHRPCTILIRSQSRIPSHVVPKHVRFKTKVGDLPNSADLYTEGDVMILPRKFGGLCLPMNEALSAGLPVLMPDCPPQSDFLPPSMLIRSRRGPAMRSQFGPVPTYEVQPHALAQRIDELIDSPEEVAELSRQANVLADKISWDTLRPDYLAELERVVAE